MKRLVQFSDGKYGIRKGYWLFGYRFQDFKHTSYFWTIRSKFINDCKTTKEKAQEFLKPIKYKIIK
jgi:hypothetical protein